MNKEAFTFGNSNYFIEDEYVFESSNCLLTIAKDIFNDETIQYANKLLEKYNTDQERILNYMLDHNLREIYGSKYTEEEIKNSLKKPIVKIISKNNNPAYNYNYYGAIEFTNPALDGHFIILDFKDELLFESNVQIDG